MNNNESNEFSKLKVTYPIDLEKIAKEYGMSVRQMVDFHNQHCRWQEFLSVSLNWYIEYLILPKDKYTQRQARLIKSNRLSYPTKGAYKYGVTLNIVPKNLQILYTIDLKKEGTRITLDKEKTYINKKEVEKSAERLYEKVQGTLYPMVVSLHEDGTLEEIKNTEEIEKRWVSVKKEITQYNVGATSDEMIEKIEKSLAIVNQKNDHLYKSIFYALFFTPMYGIYPEYKKTETVRFYFSGLSKFVNYETSFELHPEYDHNGDILVQITGEEKTSYHTNNNPKGRVDIGYTFCKDTHAVLSIKGNVSTYKKGVEHKMQFSVYELS